MSSLPGFDNIPYNRALKAVVAAAAAVEEAVDEFEKIMSGRNKRQRAEGGGEEQQLWNECYDSVNKAFANERSSANTVKEIFELEKQMDAAMTTGASKNF